MHNRKTKDLKNKALMCGITTFFIATCLFVLKKHSYPFIYLISLYALFCSFFKPLFFYPFSRMIELLITVFSKVILWISLSLVYLVCFIPISLLSRCFGHHFLELKIDCKATSYWIDKKPNESMKNLLNQY